MREYQKKRIRQFAGAGGIHDKSIYARNTSGCRYYVFTIDTPGSAHYRKGEVTWQGTFVHCIDDFWRKEYTHFMDRATGDIFPTA
jgi:hypothetical protein